MVYRPCGNNTDINVKATHQQFVVYDVLHQVRFLRLAEVQPCVPKPQVTEIILERRVNITFSFYVIPCGFLYQEGVLEIIKIFFYRRTADFRFLHALKRVCKLVRIGETTDVRRNDVKQLFKVIILPYVISVFNVTKVGFGKQQLKEL